LQDVPINSQCYSPSTFPRVVSTERNRFLDPLLNLLAVFRSSVFQRDRACTATDDISVPTNTNQHSDEGSRMIQAAPSRCRRSAVKHCAYSPGIQPNESYLKEVEHSLPPKAIDSEQITSEHRLTVNRLPSTEQLRRPSM
jgi:hypothetical protein